MHGIDKMRRLRRIHILGDSMPQIEHMTIAWTKLRKNTCHFLLNAGCRGI